MERYSIYTGHMDDLMQKVTRIQNKCKKFGCDFHFAQVGEEIKEVKDLDGNLVKCKFIIVEAEGTAVINGWEFIASVEHTPAGNIFTKAMLDAEIPEAYRTMNPICEHCNSRRTRKSTFIIRNTETGEFKMVGKSCLMDFTNGLSASTAVWFASLKQVFEEAEEAPISCGRHEILFSTRTILQYSAEVIRHFGYTKFDSEGESTKERMERFLMVDRGQTRFYPKELVRQTLDLMEQVKFNAESKEATEMVDNALNWILNQEAKNDYLHNLKTACSLEDTHCGRFGILVSLFPTFNRELEVQAQRAEKQKVESKSEHQGQVGDKLTIDVESIKCITSWESCFDGYHYSTTYVWKIVDKQGNVYTWKTSKWMDEEKAPKTIKGTVKEHKVFREIKQTELTRCRVA